MSGGSRAREELQKYFGFVEFLEGQEEVINTVLQGRDCVAVMPTGAGKSLCYQLPAVMRDGVTLVVSPLIALMKDQVDALNARGIPSAFINSSLDYPEVVRRLAGMRQAAYRIVFIAPERFRNEAFIRAIGEVDVKLLAVDEAHCISHWGHDFRPDYRMLKGAAAMLGQPQIVALTATATPQVRADIAGQLGLREPGVFVAGFDRPNLALRVVQPNTEKEKFETVKRIIQRSDGAGIIYAATRKVVERVSSKLKMAGFSAEAYHGGMDEAERTRGQEKFMRGELETIVATNAFGMGIDKPDIRFVAHFNLPGSIEAYYQEIGRAGRDRKPAECVLLFNYADTRTQQFFIDGSHPHPDLIRMVYDLLYSESKLGRELTAREIGARLGIKNEMSVGAALAALEKAGHVERGRNSASVVFAVLNMPVESALGIVSGNSLEAVLLRELVFRFGVGDRAASELDTASIARYLRLGEAPVARALHRLASQGLLTCRAAYRGQGVRCLDSEVAATLRIDKKEHSALASAQQAKLRKVVEYCYSNACLRRYIATYFGDSRRPTKCANCSSCVPEAGAYLTGNSAAGLKRAGAATGTLAIRVAETKATKQPVSARTVESPALAQERAMAGPQGRMAWQRTPSGHNPSEMFPVARPLNQGEVIVVKKVLSCVARLNDRFGKGTITAVLMGSTSDQITRNELHRLPTYGLLGEMSRERINEFLKALIQAGCVSVSKGAYPTIKLSDFGREVMTGRAEVLLSLPE